jgi:hypothetical protein
VDRSDLLDAIDTLALDGEAPTAERLATHIGLTFKGADPTTEEVEAALDKLVSAGTIRRWRVFATERNVATRSDWITVFLRS